ncbi:FkbM family methyltransferase [Aeoliella sp. SH292]|uniref:FkbM family methyltransferase n=1 Tax=Aeoliella sp. SH292 TaxID=3454464 RepID=UPI003F9DB4E1
MSLTSLIPFRRNAPANVQEFGYTLKSFELSKDGHIDYAQWQHPKETQKTMTQAMVDAVRQFVNPGDLVIDIGAHTGDTTVPMALATGPSGLTLALEPNPYVFKILSKNASLNPEKTRIDALNFAATKQDGKFTFHYTDGMYCNGGFKTQQKWPLFRRRHPLLVEGRNFNYILKTKYPQWLKKLSYVKVDAEGYDLKILQSLLPTISERRPVIRCEVFRKLVARERYELHDYFTGLGYDVVRYLGIEEGPGEKLSRREMTATKHFDIVAMPKAVKLRRAA